MSQHQASQRSQTAPPSHVGEDAPGDLQRFVEQAEATVAADPELAASLREVLHHLRSAPLDLTGGEAAER